MPHKRNSARIFKLYCFLFALLAAWILKFIFSDAENIISNPYNPRIRLLDSRVLRGDVSAAGGEVLAATGADGTRRYPFGRAFAHPIGFSGTYTQGVESVYSADLLKVRDEITQRTRNLLSGLKPEGNSIILTLDFALQSKAYELLDGRRGAIVAVEPSTGKILACASSPSFDPNRTALEWDGFMDEDENEPLLNRAVQGQYPPGSVFKIITLAAAMRYTGDWEDFVYNCEGEQTFGSKTLHCYNGTAHGEVGYQDAFAKSCNIYFAALGEKCPDGSLRECAESLLFNRQYPLGLEYVKSSFSLTEDSGREETAETSIGQGRTLVTPMHMALIACAAANDGYLMQPYIMDSAVSPSGKTVKKNLPKISERLFSSQECAVLSEAMEKAVTDGTASALSPHIQAAGKTGSAENASGDDHGWFVGFSGTDNPEIAVAVLIENCGGSSKVLPLVQALLQDRDR